MTKNIILIVLAIFTTSFAISFLIVFNQLKKSNESVAKLLVLNELLNNMQTVNSVSDTDVHKESFIKFLSDSRDWAFTYIEDVQSGIKEFLDAVEPDLAYFDEYGELGSAYPNYDSMVRINNAYKKLKTLMPKEEETKK